MDSKRVIALLKSNNEEDQIQATKLVIEYIKKTENGENISRNIEGLMGNLVDMLYGNNEQQIAAAEALEWIAKDEYIEEEFEQLGGMSRLDYLCRTWNKNVVEATERAYKNIRYCVKEVGLGNQNPETRRFEYYIRLKQDLTDSSIDGVGGKLWPAAYILSRWICDNRSLFKGKRVVEVGSGPGLCGFTSALFADHTTLTDNNPMVLNLIKVNLKLNKMNHLVEMRNLDWNDVASCHVNKKDLPLCDVVVGSDVIYGIDLAVSLAHTIAKLLDPSGIFYGVVQSNRIGVEEFVAKLKELKLIVSVDKPPEKYFEKDFHKTNLWYFITCKY